MENFSGTSEMTGNQMLVFEVEKDSATALFLCVPNE